MPDTPTRRGAVRFGLAARGSLYALLAIVVVSVAFGGERQADSQGALRAVASQPFGRAALVLLALGFVVYAAWQATCVRAACDTKTRVAAAARALIWVGLAFTAARIALGSGGGANSEESFTARVLNAPFGTWLVAAGGIAVVAVALSFLLHLRNKGFLKDLRPLPAQTKQMVTLAARVGITSRSAVYMLAGAFLIRAAVRHDPDTGVGLDGALAEIARAPYGTYLLIAVAAGLASYAVWCAMRARYEDVARSDG